MKSRKYKNMDFRELRFKIFLQMLALIVIAIALVEVLYLFLQGRLGEWVVGILQNIFHFESENAQIYYQHTFRDNWDLIMFTAIATFFLIFFHFSLSWFTKYFNQIDGGIDALINGGGKDISLSSEMSSMEQKLNTVKRALEKRALEIQLAEQKRNDLVMYLGHDIKTPLTSIIGYLCLLDEAPDMPAEQKGKYVKITLEKAYRLESLINEFFEVERYSQQTIPLEKQNVDISYMLIQMPDEFYPLVAPTGKKIAVDTEDTLLICGDPDKLARAFTNIIKNAVTYSDDNSTIFVSAKTHDNMVTITIANTGKTIPLDKQKVIFEKFYRLDDARSTNTGGAGLGLAIVKEIITLHNGQISIQSENGKTVFTVTLPL